MELIISKIVTAIVNLINGSIIPSILLHGAGNFLVSMSLAFA